MDISPEAELLLSNTELSPHKTEIVLVFLRVVDLGFREGTWLQEIISRAMELGLELCPAETGPSLVLSYRESPPEWWSASPGSCDWIFIGMSPITCSDGVPRVFAIGRDSNGLHLDARYAGPESFWGCDAHFAFIGLDLLGGKPVVWERRRSASQVLEELAQNPDINELLADHPDLTRADVQACLSYARAMVTGEEVRDLRSLIPVIHDLAAAVRQLNSIDHQPIPVASRTDKQNGILALIEMMQHRLIASTLAQLLTELAPSTDAHSRLNEWLYSYCSKVRRVFPNFDKLTDWDRVPSDFVIEFAPEVIHQTRSQLMEQVLEMIMLLAPGRFRRAETGFSGQIRPGTKVYVGPLVPGIFDRLTAGNVEHIYTSFPEGKIRRRSIEIGGKTKEQLENTLRERGVNIYN